MTKAMFCTYCSDIVAPYRNWEINRSWRWCQCERAGTRWRDGTKGLLEVTASYPQHSIRVIGLDNTFLAMGMAYPPANGQEWRELHAHTTSTCGAHYLFHAENRNCWALIIRLGDSGDVYWVPWDEARAVSPRETE